MEFGLELLLNANRFVPFQVFRVSCHGTTAVDKRHHQHIAGDNCRHPLVQAALANICAEAWPDAGL